jgi:ribosomal protein S18 acetylase RimI-like enzyme
MEYREYTASDENGWVQCRLLSFLDCSYYDDVRITKETYIHPSVCYIAEENDTIVGFIDVEYERKAGDVCYFDGEPGAVVWHLGVLPEYRRKGVAKKLWATAKAALVELGVKRFEVWTQDDIVSNEWYVSQGFVFREAYLSAYIRGSAEDDVIKKYINLNNAGEILGVRSFNFEAPLERKKELEQVCYRLHEVRVYELVCR